jgi:hypothetical protein
MSNLILKPTNGGSLILQEDGGAAALTVGTTGNVTLTGTANDLGTIADTTTFPSGHVVGTHIIEHDRVRNTGAGDDVGNYAWDFVWGKFTKKFGSTTKLMWNGCIIGHYQYDSDDSGLFISFESDSLSQSKHRGAGNNDFSLGPGATWLQFVGGSTACVYAEEYTVKWGMDTASGWQFRQWGADSSNDPRYNGARVSALLIWEVVI